MTVAVVSTTWVAARGVVNKCRTAPIIYGRRRTRPHGTEERVGVYLPRGAVDQWRAATPDPATVDCTRRPVLGSTAAAVIRRNAPHLNDRRLCETFIVVRRKTRHSSACLCVYARVAIYVLLPAD